VREPFLPPSLPSFAVRRPKLYCRVLDESGLSDFGEVDNMARSL